MCDKFGALARSLAMGFDPATVKLDQMSHYRQAQAKPAVFTGHAAIALAESLEDYWQEIRSNSFAGVGHNEFDVRIGSLHADLNGPAIGSEFDRVGEQIPEHLLQAVGIAGCRSHTAGSMNS